MKTVTHPQPPTFSQYFQKQDVRLNSIISSTIWSLVAPKMQKDQSQRTQSIDSRSRRTDVASDKFIFVCKCLLLIVLPHPFLLMREQQTKKHSQCNKNILRYRQYEVTWRKQEKSLVKQFHIKGISKYLIPNHLQTIFRTTDQMKSFPGGELVFFQQRLRLPFPGV